MKTVFAERLVITDSFTVYLGWTASRGGLTQPHSQGSGHLLEIVSAAGIKDGAALEQLQGLLDFALETQDQRCVGGR